MTPDITEGDRIKRSVRLNDGRRGDVEGTVISTSPAVRDDGTETDGQAITYHFTDPIDSKEPQI